MKDKFRRFLEEIGFLPIKEGGTWKSLLITHGNPKEQEKIHSEIEKNLKDKGGWKKGGLYLYKKDGRFLYVGKAKELKVRLMDHYKESCPATPKKYKAWYDFFSENKGKVEIYWTVLEIEEERRAVERILEYILEPEFETFRKKYKIKED